METADEMAPAAHGTLERRADRYRPGRPTREQARIIAARRKRIRDRYLAGATILAAAQEEGVAFETAREDLLKLGVAIRPKPRKYGPDEQRVCDLCGDMVVADASAIARGRTRFYCDACKGQGGQKTQTILTRSERDELILLLYLVEGRTQRFIASRLSVSESIVHRELHRLGLPTDKHRRRQSELSCAFCGESRLSYRHDSRFCSQKCWGKWRWKHREGIDALVEGMRANSWGPLAIQRWWGRWGGSKPPDSRTRPRGRPRGFTDEQEKLAREALAKGRSDEVAARLSKMTRRQVQHLRTKPAQKPL
jgi:hypothetical protein